MAERVSVPSGSSPVFPVKSVALLLIAVSVMIKGWAAFGSWFYEDDLYFLSVIAQGDNDLDWYLTRHNVHFMPLSLLLATPVGMLGNFAWWAAALEITLMYTGAALACLWMLTRIFGSTPRILAPLVLYLFSPFMIPAVTWWAVAINVVAVQIPLFVLIGAHVEYLRTRSRRWLVVVALMMTLIGGIYVKALVVTAVVGLLTVFYAVDERPIRRLRITVTRWWPMWTVYVVAGTLTGWIYLRQGDNAATTGRPDFDGILDSLLMRNLLPGLFGGPWRWGDMGGFPRLLANPTDLGLALSFTLLVGGIAYAVYRWHNAWMPFVLLAPPIAVTIAALTTLRAGNFSSLVGLEPKYWADLLPYLVLAFALLIMPIPGLPPVRRRRETAPPAVPMLAIVGIGAAYVVSGMVSVMSYVEPWHTDFPARQFITGALDHSDPESDEPLKVADVSAPASVMLGALYPYNTPDRLFAQSPGRITGVDAGVDLRFLDIYGVPQVAKARPDMTVDLSSKRCFTGTKRFDLPRPTFNYPFWVTVEATFDQAQTFEFTAGSSQHSIRVPSGRHLVSFRTKEGFERVWITAPGGAEVCPESITIGGELERQ